MAKETHKHKILNALQSALLRMAALAGFVGWMLFGEDGVVWAVAVGTLTMAIGPGLSPRWVLRMSGGGEISGGRQIPVLHQIIRALSERAGLARPPRLYYIPTRVCSTRLRRGVKQIRPSR